MTPRTMTADREAELRAFSTRGYPAWGGGSLGALQEQARELDAERAVSAELAKALREMVRAIHEPDTMAGLLVTQSDAALAKYEARP